MTGKKDTRALTSPEKHLWRKVIKDVSPLDQALTQKTDLEEMADLLQIPPSDRSAGYPSRQSAAPYLKQPLTPTSTPVLATKQRPPETHSVINSGDPRTAKRVSRGRIDIEATLDLHGLTQEQAFTLLATFLTRAQRAQQRHLLVITGKGPVTDREAPEYQVTRGILRRRFLEWVDGPFKDQISSVRQAAQHHGGAGAFYVFMKSKKPAR